MTRGGGRGPAVQLYRTVGWKEGGGGEGVLRSELTEDGEAFEVSAEMRSGSGGGVEEV